MATWNITLPANATEGAETHIADHNTIVQAISELRTVADAIEAAANAAPAWGSVTGKPSTFAPAAHEHAIGDVTGLQGALDDKQASGSYATTAQVNGKADQSALDALATRVDALEQAEPSA